jgi:hypothetical protein
MMAISFGSTVSTIAAVEIFLNVCMDLRNCYVLTSFRSCVMVFGSGS